MQKGFAPILILVGILVLAAVAGGAYYLWIRINNPVESPNWVDLSRTTPISVPSATPTTSPVPTGVGETTNWKTYTSTKYNFLFNYPQDWIVTSEEQQGEVLKVLVKGPNQIALSYFTGPPGVGGKCDDDSNKDLGREAINVFNKPLNLFYFGNRSKNTILYAYIIKGDIPCPNIAFFDIPPIKGIDASWVESRLGSAHIFYGDESNNIEKQTSDFKSADSEVVKKILSTFRFD